MYRSVECQGEQVRLIRKKIEPDPAKPQYILNVWGMGYKFNKDLVRYNL